MLDTLPPETLVVEKVGEGVLQWKITSATPDQGGEVDRGDRRGLRDKQEGRVQER